MDSEVVTVAIACDHAGYRLKSAISGALAQAGHTVLDFGSNGDSRVDYPDYAHAVCRTIAAGQARFGVLVCGSGVGMSIAANRHPEIRCALVSEVTTARLCRAHNDANVIALGARLIGEAAALDILHAFLATPYEGGRHDQRLAKLAPA